MSRFIEDKDGDHIQVLGEQEGALFGVTIAATQRDNFDEETTTHHATVGPVDPHVLIEAIKAECEMHEDDEESLRALEPDEDAPDTIPLGRDEHGRFIPATAEAPRLWAGADEPVIDSLIGRVADLESVVAERTGEVRQIEAHSVLADHWNRRLEVVRSALSMTPRRGESKPVGIMAAFGGTKRGGEVSVTDALKIARFAADEDRDIPGVDK